MHLNIDHIAILTTSLERSASQLPSTFELEEPETHASEGTREQYVLAAAKHDPSILLLEAIQPGPYQRALAKRGPGLHHIGVSTDSIDDAVAELGKQGLLLHPSSLKTYAKGLVWMCRPGVPFLIELFRPRKPKPVKHEPIGINIPASELLDRPLPQIVPALQLQLIQSQALSLTIAGQTFTVPT